MGVLAAPLMIVGSLVSAGSTIMGGLEADAIGKNQKKQYYGQANTEQAISQRQAVKDRLEMKMAESRGLAVGAASGGGTVETAGFSDIIGGINEEGTMNALTSLWEGDERAAGLRYAGDVARWQGKQAKKAAFIGAAGQLLAGAANAAYAHGNKGATPAAAGRGAAVAGTSVLGDSSSLFKKYG